MKKTLKIYLGLVAIISFVLGLMAIINPSLMLSKLGFESTTALVAVYQRFGITIFPYSIIFWFFKSEENVVKTRVILLSLLFLYGGLGVATFLAADIAVAIMPLIVESVISLCAIILIYFSFRR